MRTPGGLQQRCARLALRRLLNLHTDTSSASYPEPCYNVQLLCQVERRLKGSILHLDTPARDILANLGVFSPESTSLKRWPLSLVLEATAMTASSAS